jgi:protein phosphatase
MVRGRNEDRFAIVAEHGLGVVADGMGGEAAGDVAAQMAVELVCEPFADLAVPGKENEAPPQGTCLLLLVAAIENANRCIYGVGQQIPGWRGMGTTIACVLVCGERAIVAHVGDTRIHRLRDRSLTALTEDHSVYSELVHLGIANPDRPEECTKSRHVLTRAVGTRATVEVDTRLVDVAPSDTFLITSDGLHGVVSQREITEILLAHPSLDDAVERLIARANNLGGPDNITAVLMRVG